MTTDSQARLRADDAPDADRFSAAVWEEEANKRTARRHGTAAEIGLMRIGNERDFCRIRNISPTGLMAQIYRSLWVGDDVDIDLKCGLSLRGTVVWVADHVPPLASRSVRQAGVRFHEPIDIGPLLSSEIITHTGTLQRWPRLIAGCPLRLVQESGRQMSGWLCDISQQGAKLICSQSIPGKGQVSLVLRGLPPLKGSVRWHHDHVVGLAFDTVIGLEELANWIQERRAEGLLDSGDSAAVLARVAK